MTALEWQKFVEDSYGDTLINSDAVGQFIFDAVAEERDACAKIAETLPFRDSQMDDGRSDDIAAAIRERTT